MPWRRMRKWMYRSTFSKLVLLIIFYALQLVNNWYTEKYRHIFSGFPFRQFLFQLWVEYCWFNLVFSTILSPIVSGLKNKVMRGILYIIFSVLTTSNKKKQVIHLFRWNCSCYGQTKGDMEILRCTVQFPVSRDSVVGIATSYGLDDRGSDFESR
jgi:hypothetical protein